MSIFNTNFTINANNTKTNKNLNSANNLPYNQINVGVAGCV